MLKIKLIPKLIHYIKFVFLVEPTATFLIAGKGISENS